MKGTTSIKLKAAVLLFVFSLNTIVSMACAMGFNTSQHEEEKAIEVSVHVHADGKKHLHNKEEKKVTLVHVHADGKKHHHENEAKKNHDEEPATNHYDKKDDSKKDNCCNDEVLQFQKSDKSLGVKAGFNIPILVAIITAYFAIDIFKTVESSSQKYIANYFHPPPPDIRIAIQSFQI